MTRESLRQSPQRVDPLSWYTGPRIPILLVVILSVIALSTTLLHWGDWANPWEELVAIPFFVLAGYILSTATRPQRPQFGPILAMLVLLIASAGFLVSADGAEGGTVPIEQWWAPTALALILAGLAPYSSAWQMLVYSIPPLLVAAIVAPLVYPSGAPGSWPLVSTLVIAASSVLGAGIAGGVFSYTVTSRMIRAMGELSEDNHSPVPSAVPVISDFSPETASFLEAIAASGRITPQDRERATQLADTLRIELVTAANRSWLDTLALSSGLVINDPQRLADRMNENQRAALRGLLVEVTESPVVPIESVSVEIRGERDGSTAVALSMDVNLPEGRRVMLLAPHYLTLKTTVDDLSWDDGRSLLLQFRIPPQQ
ncbi:MAG: hypothetical protein JWR53_1946 [Glaciihabitans sp.]|jgi:hypothetical protein|nr:hypothetical protein [Glaciihabitans sp.]